MWAVIVPLWFQTSLNMTAYSSYWFNARAPKAAQYEKTVICTEFIKSCCVYTEKGKEYTQYTLGTVTDLVVFYICSNRFLDTTLHTQIMLVTMYRYKQTTVLLNKCLLGTYSSSPKSLGMCMSLKPV